MSELISFEEEKNINESTQSVSGKPVQQESFMDRVNKYLVSIQSVKTKEKVMFYRLLATMTNAGMSLLKSVQVLVKQEKNPVFKHILEEIGVQLKQGATFSESLEQFPSSFTEAEIGIVKSGEKTGQLNTVLSDLAAQIEKIESISGKIKGAMMYPMFIVLVVIGVVAVMMIMVVPKLLEIFDADTELPASTKALIAMSDTFRDYWLLMIIVLAIGYIVLKLWKKTPTGRYMFDGFLLKIPVFGGINKKLVLSKFSRVFSGLLASGVSVVECLKITSDAVGNEVYKQRLLLLAEDVKQGIKIWESLDGDVLFPDMMIQMIQVGEQTAKLDQTVVKVADFYDDQVDNTIGVLNKLLEPFIIVTLAVIVGFIAIAILQPIMGMADSITQ